MRKKNIIVSTKENPVLRCFIIPIEFIIVFYHCKYKVLPLFYYVKFRILQNLKQVQQDRYSTVVSVSVVSIVSKLSQKNHTIPAKVLPKDSEALFNFTSWN